MANRKRIVCEPLNSYGYMSHRWDVFTNKCMRCNIKKTKPKSRTQLVLEENSKLLKVIKIINAENARYREALEFGLNKMMPEIKAQKGCWPGEIDDFEDRAREALKGGE